MLVLACGEPARTAPYKYTHEGTVGYRNGRIDCSRAPSLVIESDWKSVVVFPQYTDVAEFQRAGLEEDLARELSSMAQARDTEQAVFLDDEGNICAWLICEGDVRGVRVIPLK